MPEESQEQPQETRPEQKPGEGFGYLRGEYEPSIKRAKTVFGENSFKTLLEKREKASTQEERDEINKFIEEKRKEKKKVIHEFKELEDLGYKDALTGLYNRAGFDKRLEEEAARMKRQNYKSVIGIIDLNKLKHINDTKGHRAGDEYIKKAAGIIRRATRLTDLAGRLGGDEFGIVLQNTDMEGAREYWERLQKELEIEGIGLAIGFSELDPDLIEASRDLADLAMYKAKGERGGNGESHMQTAYNLTVEEIEAGTEAMKSKHNLR